MRHPFARFCALGYRVGLLFLMVLVVGCAHNRPATINVPPAPSPVPPPFADVQPVPPGTYEEQGVASWYGFPFHGRRAADGEIYDMNQPVAAHRTLPFGSVVRVTNLKNGRQTEVRIIDRGPFVGGRIIDLSLAAARSIDMVGTGTASVRLDLVSSPAPLAGNFTVQIGAFQQRSNADRLRTQMAAHYPVFLVDYDAPDGHYYRVRVGRERTEQSAQQLAAKLAAEGDFQTFVVRLDEAR